VGCCETGLQSAAECSASPKILARFSSFSKVGNRTCFVYGISSLEFKLCYLKKFIRNVKMSGTGQLLVVGKYTGCLKMNGAV
jgi:hypothetical protein